MHQKLFDKIVTDRCEDIVQKLLVKGREYRRNDNVFHNFDRGAAVIGQIPEKVLYGFMLKHLVSVMDMLDDIEKGKIPPAPVVDEKVGDIMVYMVILEAMIKNRIEQ